MYLQNTYIKEKFMAFAILYNHGASNVLQENWSCFNLALNWS